MTKSIGTSYYIAPEVRRGGKGSYTSKVDVSTFKHHMSLTNIPVLTVADVFVGHHVL